MRHTTPTTTLTAREVNDTLDAPAIWQLFTNASPLAGLWHTWAWRTYILAEGKPYKAQDHSFFIYNGTTIVGLCPLVFQHRMTDDKEWVVAAYHTGLLPWPLTTTPEAEDFAFEEIERRARKVGVVHIAMQLYSSLYQGDEKTRVERVALKHLYIASQNRVQVVEVRGAYERSRERFRRYDKKFSPLFTFDILWGDAVDSEIEEEYFNLHVLDAGGQFRSRESYERQADLARTGEAFYVRAQHKECGETAGMLFISFNKDVAFDNSVAIHPRYAEQYVGHILRFRTLEELERRGIAYYEMPLYAEAPSFVRIVSEKERSIIHFKEGFSRGDSRVIWKIEKFLDREYLQNYLSERERSLREFFLLG